MFLWRNKSYPRIILKHSLIPLGLDTSIHQYIFCSLHKNVDTQMILTDWLCWGLTTSTLVGHFFRLPEKGREEIVKEMEERDREERRTGMKGKKQKK